MKRLNRIASSKSSPKRIKKVHEGFKNHSTIEQVGVYAKLEFDIGDYVVYKWSRGRNTYLDWVHVENFNGEDRIYDFTGWWNGESLNPNLSSSNVIYIAKSKSDAIDYISKRTDKSGRLIENI